MKKLFEILTVILMLTTFANSSFAISAGKIDKLLKTSDINKGALVSISIKNTENGNVVYEQNSKKNMQGASTLKLFTMYPVMETLGYDYSFKTALYKDKENNLYLKLGADPLLTSSQLKTLFQNAKQNGQAEYKNLYIDDSIIDKKEFSQGWMWDDEVCPYTPKISAYNLDRNVVKLSIEKNNDSTASISVKPNYPMTIISDIKLGAKTNQLEINRYSWNNPELLEIKGTLTGAQTIELPLGSMRRYFIYNLDKILDDCRINISETRYASKLTPEESELISQVENPIAPALTEALQKSSNLSVQSLYKLASAKKYSMSGNDFYAGKLVKEFYENLGLNMNNIVLKDGCGVSRHDIINADWMSDVLNKLYKQPNFAKYKEYMAQPGDGTLDKRLYELRGDARLKTGSLSNISAITGYIKSQDGNLYSFAMITQNFTQSQKDVKSFEDEIIRLIYNR